MLLTENGIRTIFLKHLLSYIIPTWEVCGVGGILSGRIRKAQPFKRGSSCHRRADLKKHKEECLWTSHMNEVITGNYVVEETEVRILNCWLFSSVCVAWCHEVGCTEGC